MSIHGKDCPKVPHHGEGYLHSADDDSAYDVDGVSYCGRCHGWLQRDELPCSAFDSRCNQYAAIAHELAEALEAVTESGMLANSQAWQHDALSSLAKYRELKL